MPFPSPGDLAYLGTEPVSSALACCFFTSEPPGGPHVRHTPVKKDTQQSLSADLLNVCMERQENQPANYEIYKDASQQGCQIQDQKQKLSSFVYISNDQLERLRNKPI